MAAGTSQDPGVCSVELTSKGGLCVTVPGAKPSQLLPFPSQVIFSPVLCPTDKLCDVPSPRHDARAAAAETNRVELLRLFLGKWCLSFPPHCGPKDHEWTPSQGVKGLKLQAEGPLLGGGSFSIRGRKLRPSCSPDHSIRLRRGQGSSCGSMSPAWKTRRPRGHCPCCSVKAGTSFMKGVWAADLLCHACW